MSLDVTSWAFALEDIPIEFTGNGKDISPPLEWSPGPEGTVCYAVIMDDPDGPRGCWVHWVVWNIRETRLHQDVAREPLVMIEHEDAVGERAAVLGLGLRVRAQLDRDRRLERVGDDLLGARDQDV